MSGAVVMPASSSDAAPDPAAAQQAAQPLLEPAAARSDDTQSPQVFDVTAITIPLDEPLPPAPALPARRTVDEIGSAWDMLLVHRTDDNSTKPEVSKQRLALAARIRQLGLRVGRDISRDGDEVILKIAAPESMLELEAERQSMEKKLLSGGYTDFTVANKAQFEPAGGPSFFTSLERLRLVEAILEISVHEGGCGFNLDQMVADRVLTSVVPLHERDGLETWLLKNWCFAPFSCVPDQPLDEVRDYLGERIALYFAFVQCLTINMIAPTAVGMVALAGAAYYGSMDNPLNPFYSVFVLLWINYFCKSWQREEKRLAHRWNVEDFEETERNRHDFWGEPRRGFYSNEGYFVSLPADDPLHAFTTETKMFTPAQRTRRSLLSCCIITPMILSVMVGCTSVLAYRGFLMFSLSSSSKLSLAVADIFFGLGPREPFLSVSLPPKWGVKIGAAAGGVLNGLFISVTNSLYALLARYLNDFENHRTQTDYEDALIVKTFLFQFVNSYISLFYIAFVKMAMIDVFSVSPSHHEYCHDMNHYLDSAEKIMAEHGGVNPFCMGELATMLTSLMLTAVMVGKVREYALPRVKYLLRVVTEEAMMRWQGNGVRDEAGRLAEMSWYEKQAKLEPFEGIFNEYNTLMIQIGYVVLFAPAFPVASGVCYFSFLFEIRTDAYKLLRNTRRPRYWGAEDIGMWQKVLWAIGVMGVITNLGLVGYTSTQFHQLLPFRIGWGSGAIEVNHDNRMTFLFVVEHLILGAQLAFNSLYSDMPQDLAEQRAVEEFTTKCHSENRALMADGRKPVRVSGVSLADETTATTPARYWDSPEANWNPTLGWEAAWKVDQAGADSAAPSSAGAQDDAVGVWKVERSDVEWADPTSDDSRVREQERVALSA